ncbi:F-box protein KIB4 [Lolium perenne]|uniref:F-box protein KIB4 n=1 Tax=Lolium perenne TaxID=4522 RepID=UPI0021EA97F9|nr:putative F-box protein At4g22180 [Lolium perenne]
MEESTAAGPDWSKLPSDILTTVLGRLEFPDLFCAADVCVSWRSICRALRHLGIYSRPQTPCLFYTTAAGGTRAAELLSLADKKAYRARLPDPPIGERNIVGSSHGWLVTADARSELHLLNPATGEQVALPSVGTIEKVSPVFDPAGNLQRYDLSLYDEDPQPYAVDELRGVLYLKAVLSCDPSTGDCTVVVIHNPYRDISFARIGDEKWHWVPSSPREPPEYSDCIFGDDGALYAMNRLGGIHRYAIEGSCAVPEMIFKDTSPFSAYNAYIAKTSSGDVLQVWRITKSTSGEQKEIHTTRGDIYKADLDSQQIVHVPTLGDDALFIGHNCTYCLSTKDYPMLLPNHVYFTDDDEYSLMDGHEIRRDVGIFNLEAECSYDIVSPQPWLNWPIPIWIIPSFNKIQK